MAWTCPNGHNNRDDRQTKCYRCNAPKGGSATPMTTTGTGTTSGYPKRCEICGFMVPNEAAYIAHNNTAPGHTWTPPTPGTAPAAAAPTGGTTPTPAAPVVDPRREPLLERLAKANGRLIEEFEDHTFETPEADTDALRAQVERAEARLKKLDAAKKEKEAKEKSKSSGSGESHSSTPGWIKGPLKEIKEGFQFKFGNGGGSHNSGH